MRPKKELRVRILGPDGGGLAGVPVLVGSSRANPYDGPRLVAADAGGLLRFSEVTQSETERCIAASGASRGLSTRIVDAPLEHETTVELPAVGGTLDVGKDGYLLSGGCSMGTRWLARLGRGGLPPMAPGPYSLCPSLTWQHGPGCVAGVLEPAGTLKLTLREVRNQ
jgi:hypothetical protein